MDAFVWNDQYATGITSVDEQHQGLFAVINELGNSLINSTANNEVVLQETFKRLADYARFHFIDEQRVMKNAGIDQDVLVHHITLHKNFTAQMLAMWNARSSMSDPGRVLHRFLTTWLASHILCEDQSVARQIAHIAAGMPAAEAAELERRNVEPSITLLLEAMEKLYGVLAQQNRDLADANRELEGKVVERTRELLQSEKMASIGQLAAGVAHEINNPLGFVISNLGTLRHYASHLLQLAELGVATPEGERLAAEFDFTEMRADLGNLMEESRVGLERVRRIVANLKDFSRIDEEGWHDTDLLACLDSALKVGAHALQEKAEIVRKLEPMPLVRCVPAQINLVFMNLLVNAAQAISGHGTITLRSGVDKLAGRDEAWVEIADTGCGMDETTQRRLFEPFFTTKPVGAGTGLGLSVAWDIIKNHDGTITVDSVPGQGSTFRVRLPVNGPVIPAAQERTTP